MTGEEFYHFGIEVQRRVAGGDGFVCSGALDPGAPPGEPDLFYGTREVTKHFEGGDIKYTTTYDVSITDDGGSCEEIETSDDSNPETEYGDETGEPDDVVYSGDTASEGAIISYAKGRAGAALGGADWFNVYTPAGGTWQAAFNVGTFDLMSSSGPSFSYSGGVASAQAQEFRFKLLPPFTPVRLEIEYNGSVATFDLTSSYASWTPGYPSDSGDTSPVRMRCFPLPYG